MPRSGSRSGCSGWLGLCREAHDDLDVVEFLRRAGLPDSEHLLDDPGRVQWRGGRAHHNEAA
ncbi:hypothetical protein [Streptomyces sp. NPDC086010]|uniref:hypothetical protein n=1 Tax=Streptomyces sp. NPDC086010 TaxID=3365745 RepID=UPI0037CF6EDA